MFCHIYNLDTNKISVIHKSLLNSKLELLRDRGAVIYLDSDNDICYSLKDKNDIGESISYVIENVKLHIN